MQELKNIVHNKAFKSHALKEIAEEDEHLPINIEIEKKTSKKLEPKKSLYKKNLALQEDSGS